MDNPKVAVLIPTLNNHEGLEIVLKSLKSQTWKGELEIAVVGPTNDPGRKITESYGATWIDDKGSRNRADACNIGIKELKCDILFFTDDDVIPEKDWIETLLRWFSREEIIRSFEAQTKGESHDFYLPGSIAIAHHLIKYWAYETTF